MRYKKKRLGMSESSWIRFASVHWLGLAAVRCLVILTWVSSSRSADLASQVFEKAAASVFVVSVRDGNGSLLSLGTGFLIAKNTLATSLHVLTRGGNVFVESGSVRLPATVDKRDSINDLAIIKVGAEISAKPLVLSQTETMPGQAVFAIGNPEALEKTISAGIVSGRRALDGRVLLQITAPISHGSSGGPILNSSGQVIGVAVATLAEGQNLNFAVPANEINRLLSSTASASVSDATDHEGILVPGVDLARLQRYCANRMWPEALAVLENAVSADEFDPELRYVYGKVLDESGEHTKAMEQLALSLRLKSDFWQANEALARAELHAWSDTRLLVDRQLAFKHFRDLASRDDEINNFQSPLVTIFADQPNDLASGKARALNEIAALQSLQGKWGDERSAIYEISSKRGGWTIHPVIQGSSLMMGLDFQVLESTNTASGWGFVSQNNCAMKVWVHVTAQDDASKLEISAGPSGDMAGWLGQADTLEQFRRQHAVCKSIAGELSTQFRNLPLFVFRLSRAE